MWSPWYCITRLWLGTERQETKLDKFKENFDACVYKGRNTIYHTALQD